ncbi:hypothetical protein CEP52_005825 [Fusarium oligoseptatum]|uniref:Rhodopsin domain-containing protein n=1 Tax=Fusarium oligoseptatum TaxID=2604345 RepID=A0A428TW18_9HYPO|nr:hypothetical protein CEP52_005825 [Fusarium oligoseptatum]
MIVRRRIRSVGLDDWLMCVGVVLFTVICGLLLACCYHGSGQYEKDLTPSDIMQGTKLWFIAQLFYPCSLASVKISICATLLRIEKFRRGIVWTVWAVILFSITSAITYIAATATICQPITTFWGETTTGSCNVQLNRRIGFYISVTAVVTDWTLGILPAILLWNIQMKFLTKLSVILVLSLGALASSATIARLCYVSLHDKPGEFLLSTASIGFWALLEEGIGIMAGSMPVLRPLFNLSRLSRRTHAINGRYPQRDADGYQRSSGPSFPTNQNVEGVELKILRSGIEAQVECETRDEMRQSRHGDGDSQKGILEGTEFIMMDGHSIASNDRA